MNIASLKRSLSLATLPFSAVLLLSLSVTAHATPMDESSTVRYDGSDKLESMPVAMDYQEQEAQPADATFDQQQAPAQQLDQTQASDESSADGSDTSPATAVTPEPGSLILLGTGLAGIGGLVRRRFAAAASAR